MNVPDDWNCYWRRCSHCGGRYHASEGGCDCEEKAAEEAYVAVEKRLEDPNLKVLGIERETNHRSSQDDFGKQVSHGSPVVRLYISMDGGCDEMVFAESSWTHARMLLGLTEDPGPPDEEE